MSKVKKILVSTQMMIHDQERFSKWLSSYGYDVDFVMSNQFLSEDDCLKIRPIYDGWIAGDDEITDRVLLHHQKKLKVISKWGTGIDSIDIVKAKKCNISILNSPGAFKHAVGELAVSYTLALTRGIVETHNSVLNGKWPKKQYKDLSEYNIGIIGFGAIGQGVAQKLSSFDTNIFYYDPYVDDTNYQSLSFSELSKKCNIFILTASLNQSTRNIIDEKFFSNLKFQSFIINVSRGQLINESSLIQAIKERKVIGAALDVYEIEPLSNDSELKKFSNIIFGSHNANNTLKAVEYVHENTINNINKILNK